VEAREEEEKPLIFVTVGTDHHPFDRLIDWIDAWLADGGAHRVACLVQTGTSKPPRRAESRRYLGYTEIEEVVGTAIGVVTHGGPGSIMLCAYLGKTPIVVPRVRRLGEHVDDHQVLFSRRLAAEGEIELAESEGGFRDHLDRVVAEGRRPGSARSKERVAEAVQRFEELVNGLFRDERS
jgi:UDP-N-acetylglucosamine transferase subunit ALG13